MTLGEYAELKTRLCLLIKEAARRRRMGIPEEVPGFPAAEVRAWGALLAVRLGPFLALFDTEYDSLRLAVLQPADIGILWGRGAHFALRTPPLAVVQRLDERGKPVLDEHGNPIFDPAPVQPPPPTMIWIEPTDDGPWWALVTNMLAQFETAHGQAQAVETAAEQARLAEGAKRRIDELAAAAKVIEGYHG